MTKKNDADAVVPCGGEKSFPHLLRRSDHWGNREPLASTRTGTRPGRSSPLLASTKSPTLSRRWRFGRFALCSRCHYGRPMCKKKQCTRHFGLSQLMDQGSNVLGSSV